VALAAGDAVLAPGEMTFVAAGSGWHVAEVTNQSTGFCPGSRLLASGRGCTRPYRRASSRRLDRQNNLPSVSDLRRAQHRARRRLHLRSATAPYQRIGTSCRAHLDSIRICRGQHAPLPARRYKSMAARS
jgi:hypothetical protein